VKVKILDDTGHTEFTCETIDDLKKEIAEKKLEDKFMFADGKYINLVSLDGIKQIPQEIVFTERLIGG